jgi:VWFA-related protein
MAPTRPRASLSLLLAVSLAVGPGAIPIAGAQQAPEREQPVFGVEAAAVQLDVVVRDKKGRPVRDLAASDFEVFEDGARQTIASFRVMDAGQPTPAGPDTATAAAGEPTATASSTPPAPMAEGAAASATPAPAAAAGAPAQPGAAPMVIAFVFDRLSVAARALAQKAALTYADRGYVSGDLVGVFSIDLALRTLQPFTNDRAAMRLAFQRAASQAHTAFASERADGRRQLDNVMNYEDSLSALSSGGDAAAAGTQAQVIAVEMAFQALQHRMNRAFDAMERDQQGFASTNGLLAVVTGLKALPGRKTVVFFSEGLSIPANVQAQFRSVVASANRANVSIYAIDAGGLRAESNTREAREEILQAAQRRIRQEGAGRDFAPDGAMTRQLERNEDLLRLNPESGLGQLADETGGILIQGNDPSAGFQRIGEDMRFHYVLSYSPTDERYDGRFRTISIKVKRPGVDVQTRKGYFAVRPEYVLPVRGYEAPAIAELERSPRPDAFPLRVAALSFPESERPGLAPVLVEVPGGAVAWVPDKGVHRADFAVVVRIKDERGREIDRLSQQYVLNAPADKLEAARRGDVLFYREAQVPPGRYTAEAVAYDAIADSASVRSVKLDVPKAEDGRLRLSSLVLVGRGEKLSASEQDGKNPLHYGEAILYPNMGAPFRKSAVPALAFYFSAYGGKDAAGPRKATIEVTQAGRVITKATSDLAAADTHGRIQHAGAVPLGAVPPGDYTLQVSVTDGTSTATRDAAFTVVE